MFSLVDVKRTLALAWPIVLANSAVPLLGLVDTAVIGHWGSRDELAALALCNLIFNFLYWAFGFLRMSTTGLVAQATGAGQQEDLQALLVRGILLALLLGLGLIITQSMLVSLALGWLDASPSVEAHVTDYFAARIGGAPAALLLYVVTGLLIGLGKSRSLLFLQLGLTGLNILLDCLFVYWLDKNVVAVGVGTAVTEWTLAGICLAACIASFGRTGQGRIKCFPLRQYLNTRGMSKMLAINRDIFIRTLFLLMGFAWFTNQSALYGDDVLAANHILLGFISFSAFFLDAFAFVAEAAVGQAVGRKDYGTFKTALWSTSFCAFFAALALALVLFTASGLLIPMMTDLGTVQDTAVNLSAWAALYVFVSVAAFQLDGIFIGATASSAMRDASILAFLTFLGAGWLLSPYGVHGLWASFIVYVFARAVFLLVYWRQISQKLNGVRCC